MSSQRRKSLIDPNALKQAMLKKTEVVQEEATDSLNRTHILREVNKQGVIAMPAENAPVVAPHVAQAVTLRAINRQGVIAMPSENAPQDPGMAQALTHVAIQKQGVIAVPSGNAPVDAGMARMMALATIKKQGVKSADPSKAPETGAKKELLADIRKEAAEEKKKIEVGKAEAKKTLDLGALAAGGEKLKKTEAPTTAEDEHLNRTLMHREINKSGIIAVPAEKAQKADGLLATAQLHRSIKTSGIIAMPSENAPKEAGMAQALTHVAIQKQGVIAVPSENAPVEAGKARMLTLATISKHGVKSVDPSKAPDTAPKKELLAEIQKEAAEEKKMIEAGKADAIAKMRLTSHIAGAGDKLKKTEGPKAGGQDANLNLTLMHREINKSGIIAVPTEKAKHVDPLLATAQMHRSINTGGVIAMPSENAPKDTSLAQALTQVAIQKQGVKSANPANLPKTELDEEKLKELLAQKAEELKEQS